MNKLFLVLVFSFFLLPSIADATTINSASCSYSDVLAAINAAQSGDTVLVPAGNCTWNNNLVITKGIYLIGAGIDQTIINNGYTKSGSSSLEINMNLVSFVPANPEDNPPFRLSGMTINVGTSSFGILLSNPTLYDCTKIRIDHLKLEGPYFILQRYGLMHGCMDNCLLKGRFDIAGPSSLWTYNGFEFGTVSNFYIEDCTWTYYSNTIDMWQAGNGPARYVWRHNTITIPTGTQEWPIFDQHGNQVSAYACFGAEIYDNDIDYQTNTGWPVAIYTQRGGKSLVYNNTIHGAVGGDIRTIVYEEWQDSDNPPANNVINGQPQHVSDSYYWGNRWNGAVFYPTIPATLVCSTCGKTVPSFDQDVWKENISFDGTSGIGIGLLSARPSTCTVGVGYWANDTKTLYKCNATNTWIAYYTPYTYPHPLRTDCINYPGLCDSNNATITVGPADCSASAVNAAISGASEGDTIQLTCTGTVIWNAQINLNGGKTLKGPGIKSPDPSMNGTWPLVINSTASDSVIKVTCVNNQDINRVTGLKFIGGSNANFGISVTGAGVGKDGNGAFRIDNNYFDTMEVNSRILFLDGDAGKLTGLIDHNVFYATYTKGNAATFVGQDWKGASPTCYGYDSRNRPFVFGDSDFIFFEDNYFFDGFIETSGGGGRYVVRHNIFDSDSINNDWNAVDGHGADTGGWHCVGVVGGEIYDNNIAGINTISFAQAFYLRGGKWLVHNNAIQSGLIILQEYRAANCLTLEFNACNGAACCEAPCGAYNIQCPTDADFARCWPLPNQINNTFIWNNIKDGNNMPTYVVETGYVRTYIVKNRDYWEPSYGPESALPSICTADGNTFYGTTDSGKLFKCTSNNIWTLQYTPYTYPHPLAGGSPPQTIPGDLNNDTKVDIIDLGIVALHFGQTNAHPQWNVTADVVANNEIDIFDVVFVASRFT